MSAYLPMLSTPSVIQLGWALIHLLWEGLLITAVLEIALLLVGRGNASLRYLLCGLALAALPVCFVLTDWYLNLPEVPAEARPAVSSNADINRFHSKEFQRGAQEAPNATKPGAPVLKGNHSWEAKDCMPFLVGLWWCGLMLLTGRKLGGFYLLSRLQRKGVSSPDEIVSALFLRACQKVGVDPSGVCLKISNAIQVPMTFGWIRPVVFFPLTLASGLSPAEIELLLIHELAHVRRHDYFFNLLQSAVEILFFYLPVTWWISQRLCQERENCCDDLVVGGPSEALTYSKLLYRLATLQVPGTSLASSANGGNLVQRIQRLLGDPGPNRTWSINLAAAVVILAVVSSFFWFRSHAGLAATTGLNVPPQISHSSLALVGRFYDLKQTGEKKSTGIQDHKFEFFRLIQQFEDENWPKAFFGNYFTAKKVLWLPQLFVQRQPTEEATKAFRVEGEVRPGYWVIVYTGKFIAPKSGTYRFRAFAESVIGIRVNNRNVLSLMGGLATDGKGSAREMLSHLENDRLVDSQDYPDAYLYPVSENQSLHFLPGEWMHLEAGKVNDISILIGNTEGKCAFWLLVEEKDHSYKKTEQGYPLLPLFGVSQVPLKVDQNYPPHDQASLGWIAPTEK